ncbi:right-handed parallel beta-helix repeat-containing protein [Opitutus sp. ER46]|uniref:right-handed parallel beta-helix repeat-containing protein n=1 Tax=Opitutus sp. ER46 TaxID=2161864 RepID=UPI000D30225E|nr:right-handed parallel beta-helix repeat-containing protein [Opitutus sp. ER46]PTX98526.1 hypothetical protein DB354_04485 [Opitutus sp. ER46]
MFPRCLRSSAPLLFAPLALALGSVTPRAYAAGPQIVPTFHCLSVYWKPDTPPADPAGCALAYRIAGTDTWHAALPLWFDATDHPGVPEHSREYRGSLVNLRPGTSYEVRLTPAGGPPVVVPARTWEEQFKVKARHVLPPGTHGAPLVITEGGSPAEGYVLYEAAPGTVAAWDVADTADAAIEVRASHVILRGAIIRGARRHGIVLGDVTDVVIEACDISGWGTNKREGAAKFGQNYHAGIYSESRQLARVVVQRCRIHHPRSAANSWGAKGEPDTVENGHPQGPQGIVFGESAGNHVLRYNEIYSDEEHGFNDGMGAWENRGFAGFPNRDSDIYGNRIANVWDDGIEAEGADMNVRIWGNFIDQTFMAFGLASTSLGPLYVFRNVSGLTRRDPPDARDPRGPYPHGGGMFKLGAPARFEHFVNGRVYLFHNTIGQPLHAGQRAGAMHGIFVTESKLLLRQVVARNNLLDVRLPKNDAIKDPPHNLTNDYDHDLLTGVIEGRAGYEAHGILAAPRYTAATVLPAGAAPLAAGSPGQGAAEPLPGFNDGFTTAPDVGAAQTGAATLRFGVEADWNSWVQAAR